MDPRRSSGTRPAVREHHRVPVEIAVQYELQDGRKSDGVVRDLSLGGAFIETAEPPEFAASVKVVLPLPDGKGTFQFVGVVRWSSPHGFGMQFGLLGARETHALVKVLADLREQGEPEPVGPTSGV